MHLRLQRKFSMARLSFVDVDTHTAFLFDFERTSASFTPWHAPNRKTLLELLQVSRRALLRFPALVQRTGMLCHVRTLCVPKDKSLGLQP
jgi:hypothetical protein